jgi:DNA polymerase I-like protein with 3'-5' exonuclease and polymerase domains
MTVNSQIGVVLERPSGPDRSSGQILFGDMGEILIRTFAHYGVNIKKDAIITYAVPDPEKQGERIALVEPEVERIQTELAPCTKVLACGPMAMAAVWPMTKVPTKFHKKRSLGVMSVWGDPPKFLVPTYSLQQIWSAPDYFRDLCWDVQKVVMQDKPQPQPQVDTKIVQDVEEARFWMDQLCGATIIAADIETDGLDFTRDKISCIGFAAMSREDARCGKAVIIPRHLLYPRNQYLCGLLLWYLGPRSPWRGALVWQNAVFDLQHLREYLGEWTFHPRLSDTLLMNYAVDERPIGKFGVHSLKDMSRIRFDCDYGFDWNTFQSLSEQERPYEDLYNYNGIDCFYTARMYEVLREEMAEQPGLRDLVDGLLIPATKALAQIAYKGLLLDQDYLRTYGTELERDRDKRAEELMSYAAQHGMPDLLPGSSQQIAHFLYEKLGLQMPNVRLKDKKNGEWSTEKMVLDKVRRTATEDQRTFLDNLLAYRLYAKTKKTYVEGLLNKVGQDGRVRPNLWLAGTATGRLSAAAPNLQNQPVHTGDALRRGFIAPPGYSLVEVDYSALEVRVFAWFSQEPTLVDAFQRGADVHRDVAARFFGKKPEEVSAHERFLAKSLVFGCLYGRSAQAITEGREMDTIVEMGGTRWALEQTEQFQRAFLDSMPRVKEWIEQHKKECLERKYTLTPFGRRRRFPLITYYQRGEVERQITNTPIQSLASDICLSSAIRLVDMLPDGADVVLLVHDSILFEVRDDLISSIIPLIQNIMSHPPLEDHGVPWATSAKVGKNWGDMKEYNHG